MADGTYQSLAGGERREALEVAAEHTRQMLTAPHKPVEVIGPLMCARLVQKAETLAVALSQLETGVGAAGAEASRSAA